MSTSDRSLVPPLLTECRTPAKKPIPACLDGLPHNEAEEISPQWAAAGTDVLFDAVLEVAGVVA